MKTRTRPDAGERVTQQRHARRSGLERQLGRQLQAPAGAELRLDAIQGAEIRAAAEPGDPIGFRGIAAVFDSRTLIESGPWGFFEEIRAGAFTESLGVDDIRMLKNHNEDLPLARNTADPVSLRLEEVDVGLAVDADMDPVSYALDLAISIERGTVSQMSFAFETLEESWITLEADDPDKGKVMEPELRVVHKVKLWEVSPVTFAAYPDTEASLRMRDLNTIASRLGLEDVEQIHELAAELRKREPNPEVIRALVGGLEERAPAIAPVEAAIPPITDTPGAALSVMQRRLRMKAREHGLVA
jgi:HK97 family phage prohead protease